MPTFKTSQFASAAASGADWREASKIVLEELSDANSSEAGFNFGFLYVSDLLAEDAESILNLFKSVLNIENWVGGVGIGLCGNGERFVDVPAVSAMIGRFDEGEVMIFPPINLEPDAAEGVLRPWLEDHDPMLVVASGDPMSAEDPDLLVKNLDTMCGGFTVGGLSSSRYSHAQFAGDIYQGGLCGAIFSNAIPVASTLSQGCTVIGDTHTITRCDGHEIIALNERKASDVFEDDLRTMVIKKTDINPDTIMVDQTALKDPKTLPEEFHSLVKGEVHAALPMSDSDGKDYLVRNIIGLNPDDGTMTMVQNVEKGERIMFVHRDHDSVYKDLSANLMALRKRVKEETGTFEPKGALYISCVARAFNEFEGEHQNEMTLIHEIIGDVPLTGFYAGGEINKGRLYGYTGILTLFL